MIILKSPRQIGCMRAAGRPDKVVPGIPGLREVKAGDIISIDIGVTYDGYVGDSAFTAHLLRVTEEALHKGIARASIGGHLSDIGHTVESHVKSASCFVAQDYVGHGIGASMHEDTAVPNAITAAGPEILTRA